MTIINEDWERILQLEAMYSIERQMKIEEEFWQYEEYLDRVPAKIQVKMFNTSIYEYTRIKEEI